MAGTAVFQGNIFDVFSNRELKSDQYGRTNILVFGTSEDDPAHVEEGLGAALTDSIMVVSIDQKAKNAVMFSVPRDLWIDYGQACLAGYEGKINAYYDCMKSTSTEAAAADSLADKVGTVFDLDIQYYTKVNYTALKDAVNSIGGISVTIDSDDPRGVYDPNFDWQCGHRCNMVKYPNGTVELDGDHALALARARDATGRGYGLDGGNFSREHYQQKIMLAIKDKASSAGTLANPLAVTNLVSSFGDNIMTNFDTSEIKTLVTLAGAISKDSIRSLSLVEEGDQMFTTSMYSGQSIVRPVAGIDDFTKIHAFIRAQLTNDPSTDEDATVEVLNGTDRSGVASREQAELSTKGIIVTSIGDAPTSSSYGRVQWFDLTGGTKPLTAKKLAEVLGEPSSGAQLPEGVFSEADFVIVVGDE